MANHILCQFNERQIENTCDFNEIQFNRNSSIERANKSIVTKQDVKRAVNSQQFA